jgi:PA domain-containing protein
MRNNLRLLAATAAMATGLMAAPAANAALDIVIYDGNFGTNIGFDDPTPVAPVGGNPGTTLGEQRQIAFFHAANKWAATLDSNVEIRIYAQFSALTCTATGAVLGSAGATEIWSDFPNAPLAGTWYSGALADKIADEDLSPFDGTTDTVDINANFNVNLGQPGCLTGQPFYLGLDNLAPALTVDFVTVLTHEMGHGLGFQTFTSGNTGALALGLPSVWDHYMHDNATGLNWTQMTNAQRAASARALDKLVWYGPTVKAAAASVLSGLPQLVVSGPAAGATAGTYLAGAASFGAPLTTAGLSGDIMPISTDGCTPFSAADKLAANGNVALINRGVCTFTIKVANAQAAGAKGVIIADNVAGSPPPDLGGADPTITIPAIRITLADATTLRTALNKRSRTKSGVTGTLGRNATVLAGTDSLGYVKLYTPNPYQSGSSVSHYDTTASRNLLMEPAINADLTHEVKAPYDLTYELFKDIGW